MPPIQVPTRRASEQSSGAQPIGAHGRFGRLLLTDAPQGRPSRCHETERRHAQATLDGAGEQQTEDGKR